MEFVLSHFLLQSMQLQALLRLHCKDLSLGKTGVDSIKSNCASHFCPKGEA